MTLILYTHTDCNDVLPITIGQLNKYLPSFKKTVFINQASVHIPPNYNIITYNDKLSYTERMYQCLDKINDDVILFLHEDMILFNKPNLDILNDYQTLLLDNKADFIKLIRVDCDIVKSNIHPNLIKSPWYNLFSIQPTMCKRTKLLNILKNKCVDIWTFETQVNEICVNNNYVNCFMTYDENERKRGVHHFDSNIFPYIATAIVKGRWNTSEYPIELSILFREYNIDYNLRG